ncbi:MAG: gluconeogenesis factor YvcK family protein [Anaerolineae bacterium]
MKKERWRTHLRWIQPGLHIKRWLLLLMLGVGLFSVGLATLFRLFPPLFGHLNFLRLDFLAPEVRAGLFCLLGLGGLGVALWRLNHALLEPFLEKAETTYPEVLYRYRLRERGPRVVVLGGGHGQATILRGLKAYTLNLTAIVTVADDGGSSGRLRREMGILPPGDFRNCIAALADDESLMTRVMQYRFLNGGGLAGHSFGNLFISAMAGVTGSFERALGESSRVLAVQGQVLPSTLTPVVLAADVRLGEGTPVRVRGESKIPQSGGEILRVLLEPADPPAYPGAVQEILNAQMLVIGPGSLYTSIMPNLLVPEIARAIRASPAVKVYVCNVATQPGETDGYAVEEHLQVLETHLGPQLYDVVVINDTLPDVPLPEKVTWVQPRFRRRETVRVLSAPLVSETIPWQHDSRKLARLVIGLLQ